MGTRIIIKDEAKIELNDKDQLCLQAVIYDYGNGHLDPGFRFIRRSPPPEEHLKSQRGQANLEDLDNIEILVAMMKKKLNARKHSVELL